MKIKQGNLIDIQNRAIYPVEIRYDKIIKSIEPIDKKVEGYLLPGFVDAHIHIESSLLVPSEFARLAVIHGTVGTVSDPHEIANVLGIEGINYMIENGNKVNFKLNFGAPSCVPATNFETAGATIDAEATRALLKRPEIKYLAEMMNYPGVLAKDEEVIKKIEYAHQLKKPVDGHAPGLRGATARQYINAGISTDHECFTYEEALEKLKAGMKILIREGSAAKNFDALIDLIDLYPESIMFCSDDRHPDYLLKSHINDHVKRALAVGKNLYDVLHAASVAPVAHYNLDIGLLKAGDPSDFICIDHPDHFNVTETVINGATVAKSGVSLIPTAQSSTPNYFKVKSKTEADFHEGEMGKNLRVIEALDGQLITNSIAFPAEKLNQIHQNAPGDDILKIAVVNRYTDTKPAIAWIKNFGLKQGAIASSVAHDSHNIVVVGVSDAAMCQAVNLIIEHGGGLSAVGDNFQDILPLPVAGLMSDKQGETVAQLYTKLDEIAKSKLSSTLTSPYMTLSFMALLVIPALKLSDKGLFDGQKFEFCKNFSD